MAAYTQAQLISAFTNANAGIAPTAAQQQILLGYSNSNSTGALTDAQTLQKTIDLGADTTTSVGVETYQFFAGFAPSAAGLASLNAAYAPTGAQVGLNGENRFIAQSVALATQNAAAKTAFTAAYGSLSVAAATQQAYDVIIGSTAATAAGINIPAAVAYLSRAENITYLTNFIKANTTLTAAADIDLAVKAAIVGEIMYAGTTYNNGAGVGSYATATNNLLIDLADDGKLTADNAAGINLFTAYPGSGAGVGSTLTLTANLDAIAGTSANDTIIGDNATVSAADQIDGGNGFDSFKYYSNAATLPALKNVEAVYLVNSAADADLSGVVGLQQAWISGNATASRTVTVANGVTAGLENLSDNTKNSTFTFAASSTSATAVLTGVSNGGTLNLDGAAITAVTLNSVGTSTNKIVALASTGTEATVNVTGGANLTITGALATSVTTLAAGAFTGNLTATFGAAASATVTTGAGKDSIDLSALAANKVTANLGDGADTVKLGAAAGNTLSVIDGGAGADTVQVTDGAVITTAYGKTIVNFETLSTGAGTGIYDVTKIAGITSVKVDGDLAGNTSFTNLTAPAVAITAAQTGNQSLTLALKDATGTSDSITFTLGGGSADVTAVGGTGGVITSGIETVNIVSSTNSNATATGFNSISKLDVTGATSIVATGDYQLQVLATANDTTITQVNASGLTKGFVMGAALTGTQSVLFVGGAGADTFLGAATGGTSGDTFKGGAGADTLTFAATNAVSDTAIYSAQTDSVLNVSSALVASGFDTITNFTAAEDKIDLTTLGFTGFAQGVKDVGALANITTTTITDLFDVAGQDRGVAFGVNGGDTYVFVDINHDGNFTAAADMFIKIVGTPALQATDFAFA